MATYTTTEAEGLKPDPDQGYSQNPLTQLQCDMLKAAMRHDYSGSSVKRLAQLFPNESYVAVELGVIRTTLRVQDTPSAACVALKQQILTLDDVVGNPSDLEQMLASMSEAEKVFLNAFYQCATERRSTENSRVGFMLGNAAKGVDTARLAVKYAVSIRKKSRDLGIGYCVSNRVQLAVLAYAVTERGKHG